MKPKLYSYVRFSSVKQREGNSLEHQQDTALKIAAPNTATLSPGHVYLPGMD